jgi:hypothetical protein
MSQLQDDSSYIPDLQLEQQQKAGFDGNLLFVS